MTWTKLGDEFSDEARDLTDSEFRTHVEALNWSNRRMLDLLIPKRDLHRFAESPEAQEAPAALVAKGWWSDSGDCWYVGLRFPEWQLERCVIDKRRADAAQRQRRKRLHDAGDHSVCTDKCPSVTRDGTRDITRDPGRVGTGRETRTEGPVSGTSDPANDGESPVAPDAAEQRREAVASSRRNGATPPHSRKREHDGPENPGTQAQPSLNGGTHRSQATDRNARAREGREPGGDGDFAPDPATREGTARILREQAARLAEWEREHPEASAS